MKWFQLLLWLPMLVWAPQARTDDSQAAASANLVNPILIGSKVPSVTLTTMDGQPLNLAEAVQEKPTVIVFYRGGW